MPIYVALTYTPDVDWSSPEHEAEMALYAEYGRDSADVIRGGAALYPTGTATTVRVTGGKGGDVVVTDGPYAETKEALTGFFLLDCEDLDAAIAQAARIPAAWNGSVEVRPALPMTAPADSAEARSAVPATA